MARAPIDLLASEWKLLARSPRFLARFQACRARESALAPFSDPDAVVRFLHRPGSRSKKDSVLLVLLVWAQQEPLGGRIVLEALRPGFINLSLRLARGSRDRDARSRARPPWGPADLLSCGFAGTRAPARRAHLGATACSMFVWLNVAVVCCWSWQAPFEIVSRFIAPLISGTRRWWRGQLKGVLAKASCSA
jgi:hypothetical protein